MTTTDIDLSALLTKLDACRAAREWAAGKTLEQAWAECPRGDWMLWLAGRMDIDRKVLVHATCACARLALPHVLAGELRPLKSIEAAEAWTRGEATIEDVRAAAEAARAARAAAAAAACAAEAAAEKRESKLAECADIVREHVSYELIAEAARMEARKYK